MDYKELTESAKVVLVEFYATWCPHCRKMMPVVEQIKELLDGKVAVYQLDIDKNQAVADEAGVESLPAFLLYADGAPVWRETGEMDGEVLLGKIQQYI